MGAKFLYDYQFFIVASKQEILFTLLDGMVSLGLHPLVFVCASLLLLVGQSMTS